MTTPNEFDPSAYKMKRLGPHVIVEKVIPLKRAVCHRKRLAREAVKGTLLDQKSARKSNLNRKNPLDTLRINFGYGTRGQWSARMERSARS